MNLEYTERLSNLLLNPAITVPTIVKALQTSIPIAIREYQMEAPTDKGLLRQKVVATPVWSLSDRIFYRVRSFAQNKGYPYPLALVTGTGIFRNSTADFPSRGRIRSGESKTNKGSGGIRPNFFPARAAIKAKPSITRFIVVELDKEISNIKVRHNAT